MIRFGADAARIALGGLSRRERVRDRHRPHAARSADGQAERRAARVRERLRHELTTLVFTPDRLAVVKGAPATRRAYLDRVVRPAVSRARAACRTSTQPRSASETPRCAGSVRGSRHAMRSRPGRTRVATLGDELVAARTETVGLLAARVRRAVRQLRPRRRRSRLRGRAADRRRARRAVSTPTSSAASRAPAPTSTTCGSRPAGETFASTARRASSASRCSSLVLAEAELLRERHGVVAARASRRRALGARRQPARGAGGGDHAEGQTVVTATVGGGAAERAGAVARGHTGSSRR